MLWIAAEVAAARVPYCYRQSFTRGAGEFPNAGCRADQELNGALCYPKCREGYVGRGPVCWTPCPAGLSDIGAFCQKSQSYTRGAGYVAWEQKKCEAENKQGCEKKGLIWYPNYKPGFTAGVTECYQKCPAGWADTVTGCTKPSYGRTAGEPMLCRASLERTGWREGRSSMLSTVQQSELHRDRAGVLAAMPDAIPNALRCRLLYHKGYAM